MSTEPKTTWEDFVETQSRLPDNWQEGYYRSKGDQFLCNKIDELKKEIAALRAEVLA